MWIAVAAVIIIIVVVAGAYYAFYGMQGPKYAVSILDDGACASGATACKFDAASITVPSGNEVVWTNKGNVPHTVYTCDSANSSAGASNTAACPSGLNTGSAASLNLASNSLSNGNTFRHTFSAAGTYNYFCNIHLWMHGTVVVT